MEIDVHEATWDLELFAYGGNLLAAIGGGVMNPKAKKTSNTASMMGGALTGAVAGAYVGSVVPGIGTAIGAVGGAVLGAAAASQ